MPTSLWRGHPYRHHGNRCELAMVQGPWARISVRVSYRHYDQAPQYHRHARSLELAPCRKSRELSTLFEEQQDLWGLLGYLRHFHCTAG